MSISLDIAAPGPEGTGAINDVRPGPGLAPWLRDWIESYLYALGLRDERLRLAIMGAVASPVPAGDPHHLVAQLHDQLARHGVSAAPPPAAVPEERPGTMPLGDLSPVWAGAGGDPCAVPASQYGG